MIRHALAALVTGATLLGATAVQAETRWSIGINLPPADVYVSNGPSYYTEPAPVYYSPAPVVRYAPVPRYVQREYYYVPPPRVVYQRHHHHHHHDRRWDRRHDHWDGHRGQGHGRHWDRDDHGPGRGR